VSRASSAATTPIQQQARSSSPSSVARNAPELSKQLFQSPFKNNQSGGDTTDKEAPSPLATKRAKAVQYRSSSTSSRNKPAPLFNLSTLTRFMRY
jgi:hypothetical protein